MASIIEYSQVIEIDAGSEVYAVTFTPNGEYLVSSGWQSIQVWRVEDGKRVLILPARRGVECVTVSKDGRWMAAGSWVGEVSVWNWPTTQYFVLADKTRTQCIYDVDFSPDSSCLVSADGHNGTVTVSNIAEHRNVRSFDYNAVKAAKYSPHGDRIAAANNESVRVWDTNSWLLVNIICLKAEPEHGLLWYNKHLLVKTNDTKIKQIGAATGSTISEWLVPLTENASCIAVPRKGEFLAYSAKDAITFWSTSTHTQLGSIPQTYNTGSIAFSPNHQLLAISARNRKIVVKELTFIKEPEIHIDSAALHAWKYDRLMNAEALLTAAIPVSQDAAHHVLASRALVRARLQQWDTALVDAKESIKIQPSVVGYIANCVAIVGGGDTHKGFQVCDIALQHFHSDHVALFLLIKTIVLFLAGEHDDAISLIGNLITNGFSESSFYVVQAYMLLHRGNLRMEGGHYWRAIQSFKDAREKLGCRTRRPPLIVSLISGWKFNDLAIVIQQRYCEALLAAGRAKEAGEYLLSMQEINIKTWVSDFKSRCCDKLEELGDAAMNARRYGEAISHYTAVLSLNPVARQNLLAKQSKAHAENCTLNDANKVIKLDPFSPFHYERRAQALHGVEHHSDATGASDTIPSKKSEPPDLEIHGLMSSTPEQLSSTPGPSDVTSPTRKSRAARLISRLGKTFGGRSTTSAPDPTSHPTQPVRR